MDIAYGGTDLRHRETLEDGEDFESLVKDGVEYVVVLEETSGSERRKFVSIWREQQEGDGEVHDEGFKRKHAASGDPGMIDRWFEEYSEGDFPEHMEE